MINCLGLGLFCIFSDKVLVHCIHGVSRSSTLVLAYLMIHQNMIVEDAIDYITDVRWIGPNMGFLNQLTYLNSDLVRQQKLQLRNELETSSSKESEASSRAIMSPRSRRRTLRENRAFAFKKASPSKYPTEAMPR